MAIKKRGPKPTGNALTPAQRKQRQRAKQACLITAAKNAEFKLYQVIISDKQLKSLSKFSYVETNSSTLEPEKLNDVIYFALKGYLDGLKRNFIKQGYDQAVIEECSYYDEHSTDYNSLMQVEHDAGKLFKMWEKNQ